MGFAILIKHFIFFLLILVCFDLYSYDNNLFLISSNFVSSNSLQEQSIAQEDPSKFEPPEGKVYHGVCLATYESGLDPIGPYLQALNDLTIHPAVRSLFISIPGERGPNKSLQALSSFLISADSIGFLPEISLFFKDRNGSTDSIIATSQTYDWIIDSMITLCKLFGKGFFLRIGGEFNGSWNGYHPYLYVTMFRKIVDMFARAGLRDSIATIWCYEPDAPNDFDSVDSQGYRWYPGDEYVDWFGLDVFDASHFDISLPDFDNRGITEKGKSERFLAMARTKGKPVYLNETSAKGINITNDLSDGMNDWNNWFAKFFEFIDSHTEIKGFNYINANWPPSAYPGWGDARIQNNTFILDNYRKELKKPKYIHLRSQISNELDMIPLIDMGDKRWKGYEGGLYPNRSNTAPVEHFNAGILLSKSIVPLDTFGRIDISNGKIVLLSIGMSNASQEFSTFKSIADTFKLKNPKVLIVNGAQGGQTASIISNPNANFWDVVLQRLQNAGATEKQVQVVWLKQANANPTQEFPIHAQVLKEDLKKIVQILKQRYPNIKLAYLSSRTYGGYATTTLNPEPYAYESGFAVKWLIEEQINNDSALIFDGENAKSPWLSWGPYLWAKGTVPRSDGLFWVRDDFETDGTHPSTSGKLKVANLLLNHFTTDPTARTWFLYNYSSFVEIMDLDSLKIRLTPNPSDDFIDVKLPESCANQNESIQVSIYNIFGEKISNKNFRSGDLIRIDLADAPNGSFFLMLKVRNRTWLTNFVVLH